LGRVLGGNFSLSDFCPAPTILGKDVSYLQIIKHKNQAGGKNNNIYYIPIFEKKCTKQNLFFRGYTCFWESCKNDFKIIKT
jgi:hypothetical protein